MSDVFISYSRKDSGFVAGLEQALRDRGKSVWVDKRGIGPGTKWREEIGIGLTSADGVVFVISPDSLSSRECAKELEVARSMAKRIVPVIWRDANGASVPEDVEEINFVWLRDQDDFAQGMDQLIQALELDSGWVHLHTKLATRAQEWAAHKRGRAYLLRGSDLSEAEDVITASAGKKPEPTPLQLEYVAASRRASKRFTQKLLTGVSVALLVALVLSVIALIERSDAVSAQQRAYSRALAADAETELGIDPELSVLLASKAYDISPTAESVDVLRQSEATSKIRMAVRPADGVSQAMLTPDGRTLVTVGRSDGVVKLWRYPGGGLIGALTGVRAGGPVAINPADGRILVAGSGRLEVFDGTRLRFARGNAVTAAAWDNAGRLIVSGSADGSVSLWNGSTGASRGTDRATTSPIVRMAGTDDGAYLAAGTQSGRVLLFDLRRRRVNVLSYCPSGPARKLLFSPDESRLAAFSGSCGVTLWNTATHGHVVSFSSDNENDVTFTPGFTTELVIAATVGAVLDPQTGKQGPQYQHGSSTTELQSVAPLVAHGYDYVASGMSDGTIQVWDPSNPASALATLPAGTSGVAQLSTTSDGMLVAVDKDGSTARVLSSPFPSSTATIGTGSAGAISPDGRLAVGMDASGSLGVFDPRTGREQRRLNGSGGDAQQVGLTDGGAVAYEQTTHAVNLWRTGDGYQLRPIESPGPPVHGVAAASGAPDLVIQLSGGEIEAANPLTGAVEIIGREQASAIAVSGDGSTTALVEGRRIQVLTTATHSFSAPGPVSAAALSTDGNRLALGGPGFVEAVGTRTGRPIGPAEAPAGPTLTSLAISPDGSLLVGGYANGQARVWSVASGSSLTTVKESKQPDSSGAVTAVGLSTDDQILMTSVDPDFTDLWDASSGAHLYTFQNPFTGWSGDAHLVLTGQDSLSTWRCDVCVGPRALRALAATRVTRGFTPGERAKFLIQ